MINYLKLKFTRQVISTFFGQIGIQFFNFIFQPLILLYILPKEFGYWSLFLVILNLLTPLISLMTYKGLTRVFFNQQKEDNQKSFSTLFWFYFFTTAVVLFFFYLLFPIYSKIGYLEKNDLIALLTLIFLINMANIATVIIQFEKRFLYITFLEIIKGIIFYGGCFALAKLGFSWKSYYLSLSLAILITNIFAYFSLFKRGYLKFLFDKATFIKLLTLSLPLIPYGMSTFVIAMSDRFIINHYLNIEEVGIYSLGYSLGNVVVLFSISFYSVWNSWIIEKLSSKVDIKIKLVKAIYIYILVLLLLSIMCYLACYVYIDLFIPQSFFKAKEILMWAVVSSFVYSSIFFIHPFLESLKCSIYLSAVMVSVALINIILTFKGVQINGSIGAVQATIIAYLIGFIFLFTYMQTRYPLPWFFKNKK